jgi:hypothetical protein
MYDQLEIICGFKFRSFKYDVLNQVKLQNLIESIFKVTQKEVKVQPIKFTFLLYWFQLLES